MTTMEAALIPKGFIGNPLKNPGEFIFHELGIFNSIKTLDTLLFARPFLQGDQAPTYFSYEIGKPFAYSPEGFQFADVGENQSNRPKARYANVGIDAFPQHESQGIDVPAPSKNKPIRRRIIFHEGDRGERCITLEGYNTAGVFIVATSRIEIGSNADSAFIPKVTLIGIGTRHVDEKGVHAAFFTPEYVGETKKVKGDIKIWRPEDTVEFSQQDSDATRLLIEHEQDSEVETFKIIVAGKEIFLPIPASIIPKGKK